jgi:hypothetical protein
MKYPISLNPLKKSRRNLQRTRADGRSKNARKGPSLLTGLFFRTSPHSWTTGSGELPSSAENAPDSPQRPPISTMTCMSLCLIDQTVGYETPKCRFSSGKQGGDAKFSCHPGRGLDENNASSLSGIWHILQNIDPVGSETIPSHRVCRWIRRASCGTCSPSRGTSKGLPVVCGSRYTHGAPGCSAVSIRALVGS